MIRKLLFHCFIIEPDCLNINRKDRVSVVLKLEFYGSQRKFVSLDEDLS